MYLKNENINEEFENDKVWVVILNFSCLKNYDGIWSKSKFEKFLIHQTKNLSQFQISNKISISKYGIK